MRPIDEIRIRLTRARRISRKCERRLVGRWRGRVRARRRRLRAAGALLRERKVRRDLQDVYYDESSDRWRDITPSPAGEGSDGRPPSPAGGGAGGGRDRDGT